MGKKTGDLKGGPDMYGVKEGLQAPLCCYSILSPVCPPLRKSVHTGLRERRGVNLVGGHLGSISRFY